MKELCCKLPKKYLYYARNEKGEVVYIFLNEKASAAVEALLKENPDAQLILKDKND